MVERLRPHLRSGGEARRVRTLLDGLVELQREVLDALETVSVRPGDVLFNARRTDRGELASEVHALGNPQGRAVLLLEVRRPGPTLRLWDNVRFPLRRLDIEAALDALCLDPPRPGAYRAEARVEDRVQRLAACELFTVDRLRPAPGSPIRRSTAGLPRSLHVIRGDIELRPVGDSSTLLRQGHSALLPHRLGAYEIASRRGPAEAVEVTLPMPAARLGERPGATGGEA